MVHKRTINDKGFSLVEVIIAMAILAIISIPLLSYFTESLKYNVQARTQQQATVAAQSVMEQLKLEDKLLNLDSATGNYVTKYFDDAGIAWHTYNIDNTTGIGDVVYRCPAGTLSSQFDVEVNLSSVASYNSQPRPVIYGFDETKDVLAVEKEQLTEATLYFQALCDSYGRGGIVTVSSNMTRTINMEFSQSGTNIHVKVYYVYNCTDLTHDGSNDTYTSVPLVDAEVASLDKLYVLFDRMQANELVKITKASGLTLPHIYFIWQNVTGDSSYSMTIDKLTSIEKGMGIIHTNVPNTFDEYGLAMATEALTTTEKPIRLVNITINVYQKGKMGDASAKVYATMQSTKGE